MLNIEQAWETNWYGRSKVDTEHLVNAAAAASGGAWDVVTMNPAMICGPILFKAQNGQWIENIGKLAAGTYDGPDMNYNIIDVRDLVSGHRAAMESTVDHVNTHGGNRYIMHGTGNANEAGALPFGTAIADIISMFFPSFSVGAPKAPPDGVPPADAINDSK